MLFIVYLERKHKDNTKYDRNAKVVAKSRAEALAKAEAENPGFRAHSAVCYKR